MVVIRRTFNLVRQDKKRVNALGVIALLLGVLATAAIWQSVQATMARNLAEEQRDRAQRVLDRLTANANARVMAFAERSQAETSRQEEIANIAGSDTRGLPDLVRANELVKLSGGYFDNRDLAASLKAAQTAMSLLGTASDVSPTGPDYRLMKANGYERVGLAKAQLGRFKEAAEDLAMSLKLIQSLTSESPQDAGLRERMAATLVNMGDIRTETQEFEDAERHFKQAIELRSEAADLGAPPEARRLLASAYSRMAGLQFERQQYGAAMVTSCSVPK